MKPRAFHPQAILLALEFLFIAALSPAHAQADWPQFLGPSRNGSATVPTHKPDWLPSDAGPRILWKKKIGAGFSSPILVSNQVVLFHRSDNLDVLESFQQQDGKNRWKLERATQYVDDFGFDEGPRATPAFANNTLVTVSAEGTIQGVDFTTGKQLWELAAKSAVAARKGFFGIAPSPLIVGNTVVTVIGGTQGNGILGLDLKTGKILWKTGDDEASYASPINAQWGASPQVLALTREGLVALKPENGEVLWSHAWRPPMNASVSAATPLFRNGQVFLSASYGTPAQLLQCQDSKPTLIWENPESMANHYATCVEHNGFLYGFHGRQETGCDLRCIEWSTGKIQWTEERFGAGTLIRINDELLILSEMGEFIRGKADPKGFKAIARSQLVSAKTRCHMAFSQGIIAARGSRDLVCADAFKR